MKSKKVIIFSIVFFLLVNTSYFIEKLPGLWDLLVALLIIVGFFALSIILIGQLVRLFKEKGLDKSRVASTLILIVTLTLTWLFPTGIINYEDLRGEDLFVASREGVANCQTGLKVKKNNSFIHSSLCFGVDKWEGTTKMIGDTVKFTYHDTVNLNSKFCYGILKLTKNLEYEKIGHILLFENYSDTTGFPMSLTYYDSSKN
jgi:hypothetical protein